jgi:hypothetical protein
MRERDEVREERKEIKTEKMREREEVKEEREERNI